MGLGTPNTEFDLVFYLLFTAKINKEIKFKTEDSGWCPPVLKQRSGMNNRRQYSVIRPHD